MKKVVVAFLAGVLLMFSGQALADQVSRIGQKVGGEATVIINDKVVSEAIIVDSKSYAPVRDIVEEFGGEVEWKQGEGGNKSVIEINRIEDYDPTKDPTFPLNQEKGALERELKTLQGEVDSTRSIWIPRQEEKRDMYNDEESKKYYQSRIDQYEDKIHANETRIAEIETRIAEIDRLIAEYTHESAQ